MGSLTADQPVDHLVARSRLPAPGGVAEVAPAIVDRGQLVAQRVGGDEVLVDDARVVGQLREPRRPAGVVGPLAQLARAEVRRLLRDTHLVGVAEQREEVVGMVLHGRLLAGLGHLAVEDRGHGEDGVLVHVRGVGVPGALAGEAGEVGEPPGVDVRLPVHEHLDRERVERHEHDRGRRGALRVPHPRVAGGDEARGVRREQEHEAEQDRGQAEDGADRPQQLGPRVGDGEPGADGGAQREGRCGRPAEPPYEREREHGEQAADEHEVDDPPGAPVDQGGERLDGEQDQARDEQDHEREGDDAPACDVVRGEERGVAAQHVQQRLGEGQRGERGEMHPGAPERARSSVDWCRGRGRAHRGRAWYSTRMPEGRTSRRSTSNDSPSARSKKASS